MVNITQPRYNIIQNSQYMKQMLVVYTPADITVHNVNSFIQSMKDAIYCKSTG